MDFLEVGLSTSAETATAVRSFYTDGLGFEAEPREGSVLDARIGKTTLRLDAAPSGLRPFYHFALLIPGDRFRAAREWLAGRVELLRDPATGETVFDFRNWNALATYFLDPNGNIVECIAHRGVAETARRGRFDAAEVLGFSELGLVTEDKLGAASILARDAGLRAWDGDIADPARLVFVGERTRTLILSPLGRGWLPTGRPAEIHPLEVRLSGTHGSVVELPGTGQRVVTKAVRTGS